MGCWHNEKRLTVVITLTLFPCHLENETSGQEAVEGMVQNKRFSLKNDSTSEY